jgi:hypothetical protein
MSYLQIEMQQNIRRKKEKCLNMGICHFWSMTVELVRERNSVNILLQGLDTVN